METRISIETLKKVQYHMDAVSKLLGLQVVVKTEKPRARGKGELAKAAGVNLDTFNAWLSNEDIQTYLRSIGMSSTTRVYSPRAVEYICEMYGISLV